MNEELVAWVDDDGLYSFQVFMKEEKGLFGVRTIVQDRYQSAVRKVQEAGWSDGDIRRAIDKMHDHRAQGMSYADVRRSLLEEPQS